MLHRTSDVKGFFGTTKAPPGSGQGPVAGSRGHGNEPFDYIKYKEFFAR